MTFLRPINKMPLKTQYCADIFVALSCLNFLIAVDFLHVYKGAPGTRLYAVLLPIQSPNMTLLWLPNELLLSITESLQYEKDINALLQTNLRLYHLLNAYMYRRNIRTSESSALFWAAKHNKVATSQKLMKEGAKASIITTLSGRQWTPLALAAEAGSGNVVELLLGENGVNPDLKDECGNTPLSWAAGNGHTVVARLLLEKGMANSNTRDLNGRTPLSLAAENGHENMVQFLLNHDTTDPQARDSNGWTPLSWAALGGHTKVVMLLLAHPDVDADLTSSSGRTALSWAAWNGHSEVVDLLLRTPQVNPDSRSKFGRTPLSWAAANGHHEAVKLLLSTGKTNPNSRDDCYNRTPLSWAAGNGHDMVVEAFLAHSGIVFNSQCILGLTPLSYAVGKKHWTSINLLAAVFTDENKLIKV